MNEWMMNSATAGVVLSLAAYGLGTWARKKTGQSWINPLLISILLCILVLKVCRIDYESFNSSARYLSYLLTPATVALAIPLYKQLQVLKENLIAVLVGVLIGVLTSLGSILAMSVLFSLSHEEYVTLLPKSITTAIGMGVSEELGGYVTITVAAIILTGVLGNMIAEPLCKALRLRSPVSRGLAIGTAAHAIGTSRAMEMGEIEGAMSSLAIVVAGLMTVVGASIFAMIY